ncbi:HU family DNA-binding protein [bacterium]|jgi:DNA-binding protein HU-beta|nr:HU family DNA-binding protein [bacterium]MBT4291055.1 HU family DNA-binding protein [bacterium]
MNKTELTAAVAKKTGMSLKDSKGAIDAIFSTVPREGIIATEVTKGQKVQLTGFGTFERRSRKRRKGRNPQTGQELVIPACKYPAFSAGKSLKDRVAKR